MKIELMEEDITVIATICLINSLEPAQYELLA